MLRGVYPPYLTDGWIRITEYTRPMASNIWFYSSSRVLLYTRAITTVFCIFEGLSLTVECQ